MKKVTIKEIAQQAGVSPTTVSFAFNYPDRLPEETVSSIRKIAKEMHYVPNPIARSMILGRAGTIGVILPSPIHDAMLNPFVGEYLLGVTEVCDAEEYSVTLLSPTKKRFEQIVNSSMVDGFITVMGIDYTSEEMGFLIQRGIPIVLVDSEPMEGFPTLKIDDEIGAYQGMKYVLECSHRNISIITVETSLPARDQAVLFNSRLAGYQRALAEFGLDLNSSLINVCTAPDTIRGGEKVFPEVWERRPTAIVTVSDMIAFGVILAAKDMNIHVPGQLSVLGFDDLQLSAGFIPPLTTIHQPNYEKGKIATELLIKNLSKTDNQHVILPTELKIRETVAKIQS
jgi:DNA-binding LacI/PurR family transcriptional regulator